MHLACSSLGSRTLVCTGVEYLATLERF